MAARITRQRLVDGIVGCWLAGSLLCAPAGRAEEVEAEARRAAARDVQALGWLVEEGLRAVLAGDRQPAVQQQVEQRAEQMKRFFQPMLESELELVRRTCGSLDPAARRKIRAAGLAAVAEASRGVAERGFGARADAEFDPREAIRRRVAERLAGEADPGELAVYRREVQAREARRAEAERLLIVARLDRQLGLSGRQQRAIEAALEAAWEPDWGRVVRDRGARRINSYPVAPDYATAAIAPHLEPDQLAEWEDWCRAAGSDMVPNHVHWSFDGQGLQNSDPWWGR